MVSDNDGMLQLVEGAHLVLLTRSAQSEAWSQSVFPGTQK